MTIAQPIIWINAFPGTGKKTIAKSLATLLGEDEALLIDNHTLIDPVDARIQRSRPDYQQERRRGREAAFKIFVEDPASLVRTVIFTDFQSDNDLGRDVAEEYQAASARAGRPFLPVYLECDMEENMRRLTDLQRTTSRTTKLSDSEVLAGMRSRCKLFRFDGIEGITIDVTNMQPIEAAEALAKEITIKKGAALQD